MANLTKKSQFFLQCQLELMKFCKHQFMPLVKSQQSLSFTAGTEITLHRPCNGSWNLLLISESLLWKELLHDIYSSAFDSALTSDEASSIFLL